MRWDVARRRVAEDLRAPFALASDVWPRSGAARVVAWALAVPLAVMVLATLWVLGVVVLSALGAVGLAPVELEGSDRYLRDGILFVVSALVVLALGAVGASVWRTAADGWRDHPAR